MTWTVEREFASLRKTRACRDRVEAEAAYRKLATSIRTGAVRLRDPMGRQQGETFIAKRDGLC